LPSLAKEGKSRRLKKGECHAADASLESARHTPGREVNHMNTPVPLAGDEEHPLKEGAIHRLPADRHRGLASKR
jgi:hypothetical protein